MNKEKDEFTKELDNTLEVLKKSEKELDKINKQMEKDIEKEIKKEKKNK